MTNFFTALSLFLVTACQPSQEIEGLEFVALEGATLWEDLVPRVKCMRKVTEEYAGLGVAEQVFTNVVLVYPDDYVLPTPPSVQLLPGEKITGLWTFHTIRLLKLGNQVKYSSLAHELWQHGLPYYTRGDVNADHLQTDEKLDFQLRAKCGMQ